MGGVTVSVDGTSLATLTDADGRFSIGGVPEGAQRLTFTAAEFTDGADVTVTAGSAVTLDKTVDWDVSFAETITVVLGVPPGRADHRGAGRRDRRAGGGDRAARRPPARSPKLLEFTPGVDFTQSGLYDFNFNTRGFNSSLNRRILTLIDGRDPSVPFLGSQEWAAVSFPLDELASVELVRGPGRRSTAPTRSRRAST